MNLSGQNIVVFDLEIKNVIDNIDVKWTSYDKMGISVGCLFDFQTMDYMVYLDDNINELFDRLERADLIVGFNITGFDIGLLEATVGKKLANKNIYDLLIESRMAAGVNKFAKGMKLDDHLRCTFGPEHVKTENGSDAPIFYQQGKMGKLISYCLADCKRESKLFMHIWNGNPLITEAHGSHVLRNPRTFIKL